MARYVVATVDDIAPGQRKLVQVQGRDIGIFNVRGEFFAITNRCPHEGAGSYQLSRSGEMIRCPWHGWEFDLRTGKSWCDPQRTKVRAFDLKVEEGAALVEETLLRAETFPVSIERQYVVIEV